MIVVDKPSSGAGRGARNALIAHCGDSLSGIGGVKRPRIVACASDKDTSGLLVVAKNDAAHHGPSEQFAAHGFDGRMHRTYVALAWASCYGRAARLARLARGRSNRTKISPPGRERPPRCHTLRCTRCLRDGRRAVSLLKLVLETGRTHLPASDTRFSVTRDLRHALKAQTFEAAREGLRITRPAGAARRRTRL